MALSGEAEQTVLDQEVKHQLDTCEVRQFLIIQKAHVGGLEP